MAAANSIAVNQSCMHPSAIGRMGEVANDCFVALKFAESAFG